MAKNELKAKVTADISNFQMGMGSIGGIASQAAAVAVTAIAAIGAAIFKLQVETINAAKEFEFLESKIKILMRSNLAGAQTFAKIRDEAAKLPIDTLEAVAAFQQLLALSKDASLAESIWADVALTTKAMGENAEVSARQIGQLFLKMEQGKSGLELQELIVSASSVFGRYTSELATMAVELDRAGKNTDTLKKRMLEIIKLQGSSALDQLMNTAKGLEDVLKGAFMLQKGDLGTGTLVEYKDLLRSLTDAIEAFDGSKIGEELALMLAQVNEMIKPGGGLNQLAEGLGKITEFLLKFVNLLIAAREELSNFAKGTFSLGPSSMFVGPLGRGLSTMLGGFYAEEAGVKGKASANLGKLQPIPVEIVKGGAKSLNPELLNQAYGN